MYNRNIDTQLALKCNMNVFGKGTENGMIKSLLDSAGEPCAPVHAVFAAIRGILLFEQHFFSCEFILAAIRCLRLRFCMVLHLSSRT
jgi:hypothetical protein